MNETNNNSSVGYGQQDQGEDENDISKVYDNDTVDFGTTNTRTDSPTATTIVSTDNDDDGDDDNESNSVESKNPQQNPYQHYLNATVDPKMIDNRQLTYIPIRLACGVCVYCSPDVLSNCPMVLRCIQADLTRAFKILPLSVHDLIRKRTNLWLNWRGYAYGNKANPNILRHATTHHSPDWLMECAIDTPQKALGIEIYSCVDYQTMRLHWNGSGLLIHELCHLIHQCCLEDGLENKKVEALYERANVSGKYEKVLRRDWAGKITKMTTNNSNNTLNTNTSNDDFNAEEEEELIIQQAIDQQPADFDLAYAMVDKKEFFAEISVAYLCNGYHTLNKADPNDMNDCNPPLLHPDVTERVLAQHEYDTKNNIKTFPTTNNYHYYHHVENNMYYTPNDSTDSKTVCCWAPLPIINQLVQKIWFALQQRLRNDTNTDDYNNQLRMVDLVFQEDAISMNCINNYHCNKFYPFTRGQLQYYDPDLFCGIQKLWREISLLDGPYASMRLKNRILRSRFCPPST
ncbi:MAG: hypothetical protein ACI8RD_001198 [Bacillariaceae sp.]|jgi:hypothetical protein